MIMRAKFPYSSSPVRNNLDSFESKILFSFKTSDSAQDNFKIYEKLNSDPRVIAEFALPDSATCQIGVARRSRGKSSVFGYFIFYSLEKPNRQIKLKWFVKNDLELPRGFRGSLVQAFRGGNFEIVGSELVKWAGPIYAAEIKSKIYPLPAFISTKGRLERKGMKVMPRHLALVLYGAGFSVRGINISYGIYAGLNMLGLDIEKGYRELLVALGNDADKAVERLLQEAKGLLGGPSKNPAYDLLRKPGQDRANMEETLTRCGISLRIGRKSSATSSLRNLISGGALRQLPPPRHIFRENRRFPQSRY